MFRKYYKEANDDIKPDRALIDKIFERAEKKPFAMRYAYRYGTVLAAVLVLVVLVFSHEDFGSLDQAENRITENSAVTQTETNTKTAAAEAEKRLAEDSESAENENLRLDVPKEKQAEPDKNLFTAELQSNTADKADIPSADITKSNMPISDKANEKALTKAASDTENIQEPADKSINEYAFSAEEGLNTASTAANHKTDAAAYSGTESATDATDTAVETSESKIEDGVQSQRASSGGSYGGGGGSSAARMAKMPETVIWSMDSYTDYLGLDVPDKAKLPSDMKLKEETEVYLRTDGGEVVSDAVTFVYNGEGMRNIYITTGKKSSVENNAFNNSAAEKTSVNGFDAYILTDSAEGITAYMNFDRVGIALSAKGVSRSEVYETLLSITKK